MLEILVLITAAITLLCVGFVCGHSNALWFVSRAAVSGEPIMRDGRSYRVEDITEAFPPSERPFRERTLVRVLRREP